MATVHLQCLCGATNEPASLLAPPSLPVETELCHCNPCRQSSGALAATFAELKRPPTTGTLESSTCYTRPGGTVDRYHCSSCGTRTFDYSKVSEKWFACSGIIERLFLDQQEENVVKIIKHEFVGDTGDGGLAGILRRIGGRDIPCYFERSDSEKMTDEDLESLSSLKAQTRARTLHASCHCGSIQFNILPAPADGLQREYTVSRWLRADGTGTKYWALICACSYCRLTFGAMSMAFNTYVMPENILVQDKDSGVKKSPFAYNSQSHSTGNLRDTTPSLQAVFPDLGCYYSSDDTRRSFCGKCGACIFFERESRPQCVNVAMGILRAESGCLAQEWLAWERELVWDAESTVDREIVDAYLESGRP